MMTVEFAMIKGLCFGITIDDNEIRFFLGILYIGLIFE